jgi:5,10-methenyltetrahydrofolate synthetase
VAGERARMALEAIGVAGAERIIGAEHGIVVSLCAAGRERGTSQCYIQETPINHALRITREMQAEELKGWRKHQRQRLIGEREALDAGTLETRRRAIDAHLERGFPGLAKARVAFCWPIRNEYDARHLAKTLRDAGATTALPVVVAPKAPLVFREWHPGVELAAGPLAIPYPVGSSEIAPQAVLLPMNGWDAQGYRLGYGGGFFDRTLAALEQKPLVIGVAYEQARIATIHPQPWDIPVDYVVTERGVYRRDAGELAFLGVPEPLSALASPVCYADERIVRGD